MKKMRNSSNSYQPLLVAGKEQADRMVAVGHKAMASVRCKLVDNLEFADTTFLFHVNIGTCVERANSQTNNASPCL
jgi:hypothetical protein